MSGAPAERAGKLYSPSLLALAASLADYPLSGDFALRGEGRSRTCGSTIAIGFDLDAADRIARVGMQVSACAVGQGSAAILAGGIAGRTCTELAAAADALEAWIGGEGALPDWPGIEALAPARAHPGRHGALLMPWKAAQGAL
ncbi:iron-sulfur cluster assembly scaffold protein [Erythrobacter sp. HL-111]|uniref:iron-sulfur cluster assembly scaffold protein n=1 Tax=Erythrobacter sp. HL-111 TaxID=1798193 RepID=UPI0006DACDA4|nr:iron-sulfur cluster assembly scaffold protein [Erythrobacter sp. HL-111]KPP88753.1 MAG: NifU-like protein [Erythrobacteraceae bacterium HL-111]SDR95106.1 NifU homolog involved in Fe-S cluster formation [Erythrobacter sp. HL-111]